VLRTVVLTQYRRVTDGQTDGIAVTSTALVKRRAVKTLLMVIPALRITVKAALGNNLFITLKMVAQNRWLLNEGSLTTPHHHNRFYGPFSGTTRVSQCQKRTSGLYGAGEINTGIHTDHPAGRHSIRTNPCPPPPSPCFFMGQMPFPPPNQQRQSTEGSLTGTGTVTIVSL